MNSVFISHNHADKAFVRKLARDLSKAGIKCWIDEAEIKVGDSLLHKIEKGIKKAKYLAVVLTPNSVKSLHAAEGISLFKSVWRPKAFRVGTGLFPG